MKVIKDEPATLKRLRRVTVELHHHDEMLMSFRPESFYKLGYPVEDVIYGDIIINSEMVDWCSIGQRWEA
jgi:hypothetical protein